MSVPPAPSGSIEALSDPELVDEYRDNLHQIVRLADDAKLPDSISAWDKTVAATSATISIAGIAAAPITGGLSLWLTVAGVGVSVIDLGKKKLDIARGKRARALQKAYESRNRELTRAALGRGWRLP